MSHNRDWVELSEEEIERLRGEGGDADALAHRQVLNVLENGPKTGADTDEPEGERVLSMSDTLAKVLARDLRGDDDDA